jgi:hypothetical protein
MLLKQKCRFIALGCVLFSSSILLLIDAMEQAPKQARIVPHEGLKIM